MQFFLETNSHETFFDRKLLHFIIKPKISLIDEIRMFY